VRECDVGLGERLSRAEAMTSEFDRRLITGKDVLNRLSQIAVAARSIQEPVVAGNEAKSVAVAAQAFAERLRIKAHGIAA
jgi:hypothetical protein